MTSPPLPPNPAPDCDQKNPCENKHNPREAGNQRLLLILTFPGHAFALTARAHSLQTPRPFLWQSRHPGPQPSAGGSGPRGAADSQAVSRTTFEPESAPRPAGKPRGRREPQGADLPQEGGAMNYATQEPISQARCQGEGTTARPGDIS